MPALADARAETMATNRSTAGIGARNFGGSIKGRVASTARSGSGPKRIERTCSLAATKSGSDRLGSESSIRVRHFLRRERLHDFPVGRRAVAAVWQREPRCRPPNDKTCHVAFSWDIKNCPQTEP